MKVLLKKPLKIRHSVSRWNKFLDCPRQYALDYLFPVAEKDLPAPSRKAFALGTQVHGLMDEAASNFIALADHADCTGCDKDTWDHAFASVYQAPQIVGPLKNGALLDYLERSEDFLRSWHPLAVEYWINEVAGVPWAGRVDLLARDQGGAAILDYKTCKTNVYNLLPHEALQSLQLQVYCLAEGLTRAGFIYLAPYGPPNEVIVDFPEEVLTNTAKWIQLQAESIETLWHRAGWVPGEVTELDISVFSLAARDFRWCTAKNCPHWNRCLGKE